MISLLQSCLLNFQMKSLLVSRPISSSSSLDFFVMSLSYRHCEEEEVFFMQYNDFLILLCYAEIRVGTDSSHPENSMTRYEIRQNLELYRTLCQDL